jgi:putative membrane protein
MFLIYLTIGITILHVLFLIAEVIFWPKLRQRLSAQINDAETMIGKLFQNQGVYNGFLAAGLAWGVWSIYSGSAEMGYKLIGFFLGCVAIAGVVGYVTARSPVFLVQAVPAIIALVILGLR